MSEYSQTQQTVLDATQPTRFVPAVLPGVDPRAFGSAVSALVKAGALVAVDGQPDSFVRNGTSFALAPTEDEEAAVGSIEAFLRAMAGPQPKASKAKVGVVPAWWHSKATRFGGGCSDDIDLAMRDAFLTRATDKSDKPQLDVDALRAWGESIGLWRDKWDRLNPGMQRMNLTNRVRAAIRNGATIELNGETFSDRGTTWQAR